MSRQCHLGRIEVHEAVEAAGLGDGEDGVLRAGEERGEVPGEDLLGLREEVRPGDAVLKELHIAAAALELVEVVDVEASHVGGQF